MAGIVVYSQCQGQVANREIGRVCSIQGECAGSHAQERRRDNGLCCRNEFPEQFAIVYRNLYVSQRAYDARLLIRSRVHNDRGLAGIIRSIESRLRTIPIGRMSDYGIGACRNPDAALEDAGVGIVVGRQGRAIGILCYITIGIEDFDMKFLGIVATGKVLNASDCVYIGLNLHTQIALPAIRGLHICIGNT